MPPEIITAPPSTKPAAKSAKSKAKPAAKPPAKVAALAPAEDTKYNIKCLTNDQWLVGVNQAGQYVTSGKRIEAQVFNQAGASAFVTANGAQFQAVEEI